jgi:predicted nucleic acid-binding protein
VRTALDSSVLIAARISRAGVCAELLEDLLMHHELVTSEFILGELGRKLVEKFRFSQREGRSSRRISSSRSGCCRTRRLTLKRMPG